MTIGDALQSSGLDRTDAEVLLSALFSRDRTFILAHAETLLSTEQEAQWKEWVRRRLDHEPVALIIGIQEFYGHLFHVTHDTLIPRPATELLVHTALQMIDGKTVPVTQVADTNIVIWSKWLKERSPVAMVVDVGTGSGCIGICLALERPSINVIATDISDAALQIAEENAVLHAVTDQMMFINGSMLEPAADINVPFILISNPPYIASATTLQPSVMNFEPASALFAGEKGIDVLHPLVEQAKRHPHCLGFCLECKEEQVIDI